MVHNYVYLPTAYMLHVVGTHLLPKKNMVYATRRYWSGISDKLTLFLVLTLQMVNISSNNVGNHLGNISPSAVLSTSTNAYPVSPGSMLVPHHQLSPVTASTPTSLTLMTSSGKFFLRLYLGVIILNDKVTLKAYDWLPRWPCGSTSE